MGRAEMRNQLKQAKKSKTLSEFKDRMNVLHTKAYAAAVRHYTEAAEIVLPPRYQKALHEKAAEIRETWDRMRTITVDVTEEEDFSKMFGRDQDGSQNE